MTYRRPDQSPVIRQTVWVQPYPQRVHMMRVPEVERPPALASSILSALVQTNPDGKCMVVVRQESPFFEFQPSQLALEHLALHSPEANVVMVLEADRFDEFANTYCSGGTNADRMRELVPIIEKFVPALRFLPKQFHDLINQPDYKHFPRFFMKYSFEGYECLVWPERKPHQPSPTRFIEWGVALQDIMHVGSGWFAFRSIDDAVRVKMLTQNTVIHLLGSDT